MDSRGYVIRICGDLDPHVRKPVQERRPGRFRGGWAVKRTVTPRFGDRRTY